MRSISNSGFYTDNTSAFSVFHLKPVAVKVKLYIKDKNKFLRKFQNLPKLLDDVIFFTIECIRLCPNIPNDEGFLFLKKALDNRRNKTVSTESIIKLAEPGLKNKYFEFKDRSRKQKKSTAIGTKFATPCVIILMAALEKKN